MRNQNFIYSPSVTNLGGVMQPMDMSPPGGIADIYWGENMITAQVQAAINDRIAAEKIARAAAAAAERSTSTEDEQIDANNKIEEARVAAINAQIARENEARAKGTDTTTSGAGMGKMNGLYIALLAAAAFYF